MKATIIRTVWVAFFGFSTIWPMAATAAHLAIVGGTLIDGSGSEPVADAVVVIEGDRILYAGPANQIIIPSDAEILDLSGLTVLPGFFNTHVHNGLSGPNRELWAYEGVTTVRDLGCSPESLPLARTLYPPTAERARLVAAGPLITVPGGYPIVPFGGGWSATVSSPAEARNLAEHLLDHGGADLLKLALDSGVVHGLEIPVMTRTQARTLVRVARGRGTVASAHITSVVDLDLALHVGATDLAHMAVDRPLTEDEVNRVVAADVLWVPTLELWHCVGAGPITMAQDNLRVFVEAGGSVALGTDYAGHTCNWEMGMPMTEIELMHGAGMTPMQIIVSATANGAMVCNLEQDLGTVEKGKIADLLVVDGDPLQDLHSLEQVRLVMRSGVVIRSELSGMVLSPPRRGARVH